MAKHSKKAHGTILHFRPKGSVLDPEWKVLHFATDFSNDDGEAAEVDVTTHSSEGMEYEYGLPDFGEFTASCQLDVNKSAVAVTGESRLNEAQALLYDVRGTGTEYEYRITLPKAGTANTIVSNIPPVDRAYFSGSMNVKSVAFTHPVDGVGTADFTFRRTSKQTLTRIS